MVCPACKQEFEKYSPQQKYCHKCRYIAKPKRGSSSRKGMSDVEKCVSNQKAQDLFEQYKEKFKLLQHVQVIEKNDRGKKIHTVGKLIQITPHVFYIKHRTGVRSWPWVDVFAKIITLEVIA